MNDVYSWTLTGEPTPDVVVGNVFCPECAPHIHGFQMIGPGGNDPPFYYKCARCGQPGQKWYMAAGKEKPAGSEPAG